MPTMLPGMPPLSPQDIAQLTLGGYFRDPTYQQWMQGQRGLLDAGRDTGPGAMPHNYGMLGQSIADILNFPQGGRGLLGLRQGARGEGGGGQVVQMPQKAVPQGNPYFGKYSNQPPASYESTVLQQQHMAKVQDAIRRLPEDLVAKIDHFSAKHESSPYVRGNALIDAAEMKAARQAWESYSGKNPDIMPPGMQYPQGKPPGQAQALIADTRAWMSQTGKLPFDSKVIADRFNKMPSDQREIFNRMMFPEDYK